MIFIDGMDDFILLELKEWHKVKIQCGWEPHADVGTQKASPACAWGSSHSTPTLIHLPVESGIILWPTHP